ncbi:GNAT family N-acetyltransferase [Mycobacterium heidelbergense]|uniref:Uncharacterized protein n=1 Tax=Mycobacterium heidelbergense TaxID=53376 RepID=A0A1X0DPI7_MYCHE|nr:GNAT family N-acetyltransferase [Mycobacterium heidelbergense]MCV7053270.1 GNAT family N-acetyltransferase [Mycobacterium heidelbergense]ORA74334.1 hypothetical protein BST25_09830 [Mycobacterium heidelbergense]BBZ49064.1 hypothetical protein MHEI_07810 [Mycobacterium heidelbergense]
MDGPPVRYAATCRLLDGRVVSLRRLTADDAEAVVALHQHLSDRDRYLRFFTLGAVGLHQLAGTMIGPGPGRYALGAFDGDRLIGVASYTVTADPTAAEIAVVVAHEDHSIGVGTALLEHLAQIAATRGIRRFVADVLTENHLMLQVISDFGWRCERLPEGSVRHVEIDLPGILREAPTGTADVPRREGQHA